jgi:hypothetical protein
LRPSSTALLTIDSEDRYADYPTSRAGGSSPYNFTITKPESLMPGFMTRIGISEVVFPWVIPNIGPKTNKIQYTATIGGAPAVLGVCTLPIGFYAPQQIGIEIAATLNAVPALTGLGLQISYGHPVAASQVGNDFLGQPFFTYSVSAGNTIAFRPMEYNSATYNYPPITKQLFDLMGFTLTNISLLNAGAGTYTFCQNIRYVDIVCNQLTNAQAQKDQTSQTVARDMLARIYVGGAPGVSSTVFAGDILTVTDAANGTFVPPGCAPTTIYRNFQTPKQIQWIPNQNIPGFLQFQVYDDTGQLLDTSTSVSTTGTATYSDWSMTMLVSEN